MSYDTMADTNTSVHSRVISAFFDTAGTARKAVDDLVAAGIPREHITQTGGETAGESVTAPAPGDGGFWDSLKELFLPEEDRTAYAEGLRRGGYLVTVRTEEGNYNRVLDILDNDGAVDMDQREHTWRSEGWSGFAETSAAHTSADATDDRSVTATPLTPGTAAYASGAAGAGSASRDEDRTAALRTSAAGTASSPGTAGALAGTGTLAAGRDEVISLYEEQLRVGKRDVSHGRVRLRSYVVETPVSEQVSLRNETVTIDRKAVNRPVTDADALFKDRVIEAEERREEAVIAKDVRVTEEITLRKTAEDRIQTVSDSVRSTKVDIDDDRASGSTRTAAFTAASDSALILPHMDVISSDGQKIGEVDHLDGPDRIKLAKTTSPDGQHHYVPFTWIDHVDTHVHLKKTLADIRAQQHAH